MSTVQEMEATAAQLSPEQWVDFRARLTVFVTQTEAKLSGLRASSVVRLGFLIVLPRTQVPSKLKASGQGLRQRLVRRLRNYLLGS